MSAQLNSVGPEEVNTNEYIHKDTIDPVLGLVAD